MRQFCLCLVAILGLAACSEKKSHRIEPVTPDESRQIREDLRTGQHHEEIPSTATPDCQSFINSLPSDYMHGYITVPEDYSNPAGRQIEVFYYGLIKPNTDIVIFYNGGPSSDSWGSSDILDTQPGLSSVSMLYIDQRGTGCSQAYPTEPTEETIQRLSNYTSREIVQDSEVLRGYLTPGKKWKAFGQSFGGEIVHRYAIEAADGLKGAYAHGLSLMNDSNEWLKLRILSQKRVLESYFQQYPDDRQRLTTIRELIEENLCFDDGATEICGPDMMDGITIYLGFSDSWSSLHQYLTAILRRDGTINMSALQSYVRQIVFGVYASNGLAASVISVVEMSNGQSDADSCRVVNDRLEAEGETPQEWLLNECRLLVGIKNDVWTELLTKVTARKMMTPQMLKDSLTAHPDLPFYLYSGQLDVFVPVETFAEEVALLGNLIHYTNFQNSGHEGFYTEPQVLADIVR